MSRIPVYAVILLALSTSVRSQFFADLFQGFQPFVTNRPIFRYDPTTRRIRTDQNRSNFYRQTTKYELTTKPYDNDRNSNAIPAVISSIDDDIPIDRRRKTTIYNSYYTTTVKPKRTKESSRRTSNGNKREQNPQSELNREDYDGKINLINDYYTQKPNYASNNRVTDNYGRNNKVTENYDRNNYYTTNNPLINRPGVKPAIVDNRPPITNRPVTKRPNFGINPRPKDDEAIAFPDEDVSPEIIIGPDEDYMSAVEKKRYIELSERMCDKYKSLSTKAVQAIPLVPSPEPVRVNVSGCTPTNVPLVVGGKVVGIKEFPHMVLLGWRKLQGPGYSWKCGGSLVSEQFVLTAAHCSYQDRDNTVVNGPPRAAQLGSSYLNDPGALVVRVAAVVRHPKYKLPRSYYDIALVKLANMVKFSEVIKPACLGVPPAVGRPIIATGWGRTEYGGDQSHELRSVSLPVWDLTRCREILGTSRRLPDGPSSDSQICAGEERGGKDTCQGDSGGPAQLQEGCVWRVVAVTSLGRSCGAAETPGLYAKVHRAFVASQIFGPQKNSGTNYESGNNPDSNGQSYGNNGQEYNNNESDYSRAGSNDNYNDNNKEQNGYERPNTYNRPQGNQNVYNTPPQPSRKVNYSNNQNVYNTPRSDHNVVDNNHGETATVKYDNNNRQQNGYNNYLNEQSTGNRQNSSNRNDNGGIIFNNDYNSQQTEYTTRKPINNGNRGIINSDYSTNYENYNRNQNYGRNNDRVNSYSSNNGNYNNNNESSQGTRDTYGESSRTNNNNYAVNKPWWLK